MEKIENISEDEKTLLRRYLPQMEQAVRHSCAAVPSADMAKLHEIYRKYRNPSHILRPWCSACKMEVMRGLYELTRRLIWER